jgi:predicted DNA-binding transcriptional regulator AlpA
MTAAIEIPDRGFLPARRVRERYGVTDMTLWRWLRDEEKNFPQPIYLGRFRYFRVSDLENWERQMERASKKVAA